MPEFFVWAPWRVQAQGDEKFPILAGVWYKPGCDYNSVLIFHVGNQKKKNLIEKFEGGWERLQGLGMNGKKLGAQEVLSHILPLTGNDEGRDRKSQHINTWLWASYFWQNLEVLIMDLFMLHKADGNSVVTPVSQQAEELCTGVSKAH